MSVPNGTAEIMQYKTLEVRETTINGNRIISVDGFHRVYPESKPAEYRRVALVDLSEEQVRELHERFGELIDSWES